MNTLAPALPRNAFNASTLMAVIVFAAITPLLLMVAPAVAAQLGGQLHLSDSQIGNYFSVELGAFSIATLPSLYWLGRFNARRVAILALAVFVAGNFITAIFMPDYQWLLVLRAITALGGGTLMVLCLTSAATSTNRDRVYGLWVVGQLVVGAVGLWIFPLLFATMGLRVLYVALGILGLLSTPLVQGFDPALGQRAQESATAAGPATKQAGPKMGVALNAALVIAGVFAFYVAIGGVWTFANKAALSAGLSAQNTGTILAIASIMGIVGSAIASWIGGRYARQAMLILGYAILALSLVGLALPLGVAGYCLSAFAFKYAWTFALPFILAAAAKHDETKRLVASLHFVIGAGLAIGPLIAGHLLDGGVSLPQLFAGATVICVVSWLCLQQVERN